MNPQEVANFIKYQLTRGTARVEIERVLGLNQVSPEQIAAGFAAVGPSAPPPATAFPAGRPAAAVPPATKPSAPPPPANLPTGAPSPTPPVAPSISEMPAAPLVAPSAPPAAPRRGGGGWIWLLLLILLLAAGAVVAYWWLWPSAQPELSTVELTPPTNELTPITPSEIPPPTPTLDPAALGSLFSQRLATPGQLSFNFNLTGRQSTLPSVRGSGTISWTASSTTLSATPEVGTLAPINLTLPFTTPVASSSSLLTAELAETLNGQATYRYTLNLPMATSSSAFANFKLWLDANGQPRQLSAANPDFNLTVSLNAF